MRTLAILGFVCLALCGCKEEKPRSNAERGLVWSKELGVWRIPAGTPFADDAQAVREEWSHLVYDEKEMKCLAWNIYFEARGEGLADQLAVAHVTLNRVDSGRYGAGICGVVFKPYAFSWTHEIERLAARKPEAQAWRVAQAVAEKAIESRENDPTRGATHYYNPRKVKPKWRAAGYDVVLLPGHVYMKLKGEL